MPELYFNNYSTTVAIGGYSSGSGVLNVGSTAGISILAGETVRLAIYDATPALVVILIATAVNSGTQFAVTAEGADANALAGQTVINALTVGAMDQIRSDISGLGTFANLPTLNLLAGMRYKQTDGPYDFIYDGSQWQPFVMGYQAVLPVAGNFTWANQGGATVDFSKGFGLLSVPANASLSLRVQYASLPSTPFTIDAMFGADNMTSQNDGVGIGFYDSSGGRLIVMAMFGGIYSGAPGWQVQRYTSVTAFSAAEATFGLAPSPLPLGFISIADDGTNLNFYVGYGANKKLIYSEAVGAFVTPNKVVFFGNSADNKALSMALFSWYQH